MSDLQFRSRRMVLRSADPLAQIGGVAEQVNFEKLSDVSAEPVEGIVRQIVWKSSDSLLVHYLEDYRSACSFVVVVGDDLQECEIFSTLLAGYLQPWSLDELLAAVDKQSVPQDRAHAVIRAGLGAPEEFDEGFYRRIQHALHDGDPFVRRAAVWATSYPGWLEFLPTLEEVALHDSDADIREDAQLLQDAIKEVREP